MTPCAWARDMCVRELHNDRANARASLAHSAMCVRACDMGESLDGIQEFAGGDGCEVAPSTFVWYEL